MQGGGLQAYVALLLWVPICFVIFGSTKPTRAAFFCFVLGIVLLPERTRFDLPLLPRMGKMEFTSVGCYLGALVFARAKLKRAKLLRGIEVLFVVIAVGNFGTAWTNPDVLTYGGKGAKSLFGELIPPVVLPPLTNHDIPSMTIRDFIGILLPFHLGRALVRDKEDVIALWSVFCLITLFMLLPMFFELRMSPQLHKWVWGVQVVPMKQNVRSGGFKSTLFFVQGLALAMFLFAALIGGSILKRNKTKVGSLSAGQAMGITWFALLNSRNVAANIYAAAVVPLVLGRNTRMAARLSVVLAFLVFAYPALRVTKKFPSERLVAIAFSLSPDRAQSLDFRFRNEDMLLDRANLRLWFGWGGYGRNSIRDDRSGRETSVADGEWIIRYGIRGLVGFVGSFSLLLGPVFLAFIRRRKIADPQARAMVDSMMLLVAVKGVDMLPNGYFYTLPYFFAGALEGMSDAMRKEPVAPPAEPQPQWDPPPPQMRQLG